MPTIYRRRAARSIFSALFSLTLIVSIGTPVPAQEPPPRAVLLVAANATGGADDQLIASYLEAEGHSVTIVGGDDINLAAADDSDLIIIGANASPSAIGARLKATTSPIINYEFLLHDDLGLTGSGKEHRFEQGAFRDIDVVDPGHPIIDDTGQGRVRVFDSHTKVTYGKPGADASIIATVAGDPSRSTLFAYEPNATLVDGTAAQGLRIGFFLSRASDDDLNGYGTSIFINTVNYALSYPKVKHNKPPVPKAGEEILIPLGSALATATLSGSVSDDGLPEGAALSWAWTGPEGTVIDDPAALEPTVTLPGAGSYRFTLTATDGELSASDAVTVTVVDPSGRPEVLLVAANATGKPEDRLLASALESAGFITNFADDGRVTLDEANAADVVIITGSSLPGAIKTKLNAATVPVITYEHLLYDDLGLTRTGSPYRGETGGHRDIDVVDPSHPAMTGQDPGLARVLNRSSEVAWGRPGTQARVAATVKNRPSLATVFTYETGDTLADGRSAAGPRAGLFLTASSVNALTQDGIGIVLHTVADWALGSRNLAPTVEAGDPITRDATAAFSLKGSFTDDIFPIAGASTSAWQSNDGVTFADAGSLETTATLPGAGSFEVALVVSDGALSSTDTVTLIGVDQDAPTAVGSVDVTSGEAPLAVAFDGTASTDSDGTIVEHRWDFGDGASSTAPSGSHVFTGVGEFDLTLTVTDDLGATSTVAVDTVTISSAAGPAGGPVSFVAESMTSGQIPNPPATSTPEQSGLLVADFDGDGSDEAVIYGRNGPNGLQLYDRGPSGSWTVTILDSDDLYLEAGGTTGDVDGDGDIDVIIGGDRRTSEIWWWENPGGGDGSPAPWTRRVIIDTGGRKHHDVRFGDVTNDGVPELIYWTQGRVIDPVHDLFVAELPDNPRTSATWTTRRIYDAQVSSEGIDIGDLDGDGVDDLVAGGRLFTYDPAADTFSSTAISSTTFGRYEITQLIEGGRPEIVAASGDHVGDLELISWNGSQWLATSLLDATTTAPWNRGHSLITADINNDGHLDLYAAEMYLATESDSAQETARAIIWYGDGAGGLDPNVVTVGEDNHESTLGDVDGDGDLDIVSKPYNWNTPALTVHLNQGNGGAVLALDSWAKNVVATKAARSMFIYSADVDRDGDDDLVTGAWWYENPGSIDGTWVEHTIGGVLGDALLVADLDEDGNVDIFGAQGPVGEGAKTRRFAWAKGDGAGGFAVFSDFDDGDASFIQGIELVRFGDGPLEIWLSWNERASTIQKFEVPASPTTDRWQLTTATTTSQGEEIEFADLDRDGDLDLMEGHIWLENTGAGPAASPAFTPHELHTPTACCFAGVDDSIPLPDRAVVADVNNDGRLDVVVSHEYDPNNRLVWYEQPATNITGMWTEHPIGTANFAIHSLDVRDIDNDGDLDVVAGEHRRPEDTIEEGNAWIFENHVGASTDPAGQWTTHTVDATDAHHDGLQLADLDNDGDLDIFSIGWDHGRVLVYENTQGE